MIGIGSLGAGDSGRAELAKKISDLRWFHRFEVDGIMTPGTHDVEETMGRMGIPADLTGKSVLDLGSYDGGASFTCERRGAARVVAYDVNVPRETTQLVAAYLNSRVEFAYGTIYTINPSDLGKFDIVIFSGLLYHLRYPALGIDRIRTVAKDAVYVETHILNDNQPIPYSIFYETTELNSDPTNWTGPNVPQVLAWFRSAGFDIQLTGKWPAERATFVARVRPGLPPHFFQPGLMDQRYFYEGMNLVPED